MAGGDAAGLSLSSPEDEGAPETSALGSGWTFAACRVMVLEVFCRTGLLRAFLGGSPDDSGWDSRRGGGWLLVAQVGEPPLWVLEQFFLSAADARLSSFGPCVVPLVTSFLISESAAFVPLTNDLFGGGWGGGQWRRRRRNRMVIWLLTSITHDKPRFQRSQKPTNEDRVRAKVSLGSFLSFPRQRASSHS